MQVQEDWHCYINPVIWMKYNLSPTISAFWDTPVQFPSFIVSVNNLSTFLLRRLWARQASSPAEKSFQVKPSNEDTSGGVWNGDGIYIYNIHNYICILYCTLLSMFIAIYTHIQTVYGYTQYYTIIYVYYTVLSMFISIHTFKPYIYIYTYILLVTW